jgi:anaerobic selenocysteine-containing dehydrogenase
MGLQLHVGAGFAPIDRAFGAVPLDMNRPPTSDEIIEAVYRDGRLPIAEVKAYPGGHMYGEDVVVAPKSPECTARLQLGAPKMMEELAQVHDEHHCRDAVFPFRLIGRRMIHVYNSAHREMPELAKGKAYNPLFMHPEDMAAYGIAEAQKVRVESAHSAIWSVVEPDETMKRGVAAMSHAFGADPERDDGGDVYKVGSNIGRLTAVDVDYDKITGMPRMSGIPVRILAAA